MGLFCQSFSPGSAMRYNFLRGEDYVRLFWLAVQEGIVALARVILHHTRRERYEFRE
jgi:hypothetical protein